MHTRGRRRAQVVRDLLILGLVASCACAAPAAAAPPPPPPPPAVERIAFGSCARQNEPQPIWDAVLAQDPDLFLFLGDNIYGDTTDMEIMREAYARLAAIPGFQRLRARSAVLATWDDHDYGANDAGAEYPKRRESQQVFLDFLGEPPDSPRRSRDGVYDARTFGPPGRRVQVILLDTRFFRSPLHRREAPSRPGAGRTGPYAPTPDSMATILGPAQWAWLETALQETAELRIVASSIQVVAEDAGWECWGNFPRERERLLALARAAGGVIFVSGDRHHAELSVAGADTCAGERGAPLYDLTASALNQSQRWKNELNRHRVGYAYLGPNFGLATVDWTAADPLVTLEIRTEDGGVAIRHDLRLSDLAPRGRARR